MVSKNTSQNILQAELQNSILHGLSCEWENALWVLESTVSQKMKKPLFSLNRMKQKLAFWDGQKREIAFSTDFVLNHKWDSIKEVLLHEMAHQLTTEVFNINHEKPHGKSFQKACLLLRANPKASGNYPPLSERIADNSADEKDKIMFRIQKLFALAKSDHIHEAEAAVAKAHVLIKKYNIDMLKKDPDRNFVSIFVGNPSLRHFREEYVLANLLTEHYFVYGIWVSAYVIKKGKMGRVLEISGTPQNIKIASYVFDFINNYINSAWNIYNKNKKLNRYRKTDFATGIIEGFISKLNRQNKHSNQEEYKNEGSLPAITEDIRLSQYTSHKYPNIRNFKRNTSNIDENISRDGNRIGRKMVISKGIEKTGGHAKKYIQLA